MKRKLERVLLFTRFTWLSPCPGIKCNLKILKHFATSWQMKARPIMSTAKCLGRGIGNVETGGGGWQMGDVRWGTGSGTRNQEPGTRQRHQQQEGMISCANIFPEHTISICRVQLWRSSYSSWLALSIWLQFILPDPVGPHCTPFVLPFLHATSLTPSRQSESQSAVDVSYTNVNGAAAAKKYVGWNVLIRTKMHREKKRNAFNF